MVILETLFATVSSESNNIFIQNNAKLSEKLDGQLVIEDDASMSHCAEFKLIC
jgi:hypothetical protein